ncbi:hypothetical protein Lal_00006644, partial [Lupinus albus]
SNAIPPSKSFLTWRLMLNKLPTDENLKKRGHSIVSIFNLCRLKAKTYLLEFSIIRSFNVSVQYSNAPNIIEVVWFPHALGRIKVNNDGAAHGYLDHASEGEIFRDNSGGVLGCFTNYLGIQDSIYGWSVTLPAMWTFFKAKIRFLGD